MNELFELWDECREKFDRVNHVRSLGRNPSQYDVDQAEEAADRLINAIEEHFKVSLEAKRSEVELLHERIAALEKRAASAARMIEAIEGRVSF